MTRLPTPGGDAGQWGSVLNDFLSIEHNTDGSLKSTGSLATKYTKPANGIPVTDLTPAAQQTLSKSANLPNITVSATAPSSPAVNDVWIDTSA